MVENKILIAYASKCGSTGEVAEAIGQVLREAGAAVDVRPVKQVADLSAYQAVVLGSAVRIGQCLPEAKAFVEKHQDALHRVPLVLFAVCLSVAAQDEEQRKQAETYLVPLRERVPPAAEGVFAGVMNYKKLSFFDRLMVRMMKISEGDLRDWAAIRAWAEALSPKLLAEAVA